MAYAFVSMASEVQLLAVAHAALDGHLEAHGARDDLLAGALLAAAALCDQLALAVARGAPAPHLLEQSGPDLAHLHLHAASAALLAATRASASRALRVARVGLGVRVRMGLGVAGARLVCTGLGVLWRALTDAAPKERNGRTFAKRATLAT